MTGDGEDDGDKDKHGMAGGGPGAEGPHGHPADFSIVMPTNATVAVAQDAQGHGVVLAIQGRSDRFGRFRRRADALVAHADDDVARTQPRLLGRRAWLNGTHQRTFLTVWHLQLIPCIRRQRAERRPSLLCDSMVWRRWPHRAVLLGRGCSPTVNVDLAVMRHRDD